MKLLLLDGHTVLWTIYEPEKLPDVAREAIDDPENKLFVSHATVWELANKAHRLSFIHSSVDRMVERIAELGVTFLQLTPANIVASANLPRHHGDPFDRILVAHAQENGLTIVTIDEKIPLYNVEILWK